MTGTGIGALDAIRRIAQDVAVWWGIALGLLGLLLWVWLLIVSRKERREVAFGFLRDMAEPGVVWSVVVLCLWRLFNAKGRLLGAVFPWPVASAVAAGCLYYIVRLRRRGKISSDDMWRFVCYPVAFWAFYAAPRDWPVEAVAGAAFMPILFSAIFLLLRDAPAVTKGVGGRGGE